MPLHVSSTMCSSSGGQNCTIQSLVSSHSVGGRPVHRTATYRCDDTRDCIIQFCPTDDEHMCSKHVEAWNKLNIKFSASSWLILINKYIEMHGQENIKTSLYIYISKIKWNKTCVWLYFAYALQFTELVKIGKQLRTRERVLLLVGWL